jgi:hypothetical protein
MFGLIRRSEEFGDFGHDFGALAARASRSGRVVRYYTLLHCSLATELVSVVYRREVLVPGIRL